MHRMTEAIVFVETRQHLGAAEHSQRKSKWSHDQGDEPDIRTGVDDGKATRDQDPINLTNGRDSQRPREVLNHIALEHTIDAGGHAR
jgi:hypothetical protein